MLAVLARGLKALLIVSVFLATTLGPFMGSGQTRAQDPISVGLIGLGAKFLVGKILDDAEQKANNLIDRSRQAGDIVVAHAGAEMRLMVENMRIMFKDLQDRTFDQLSLEQQKLFVNLNRTLESIPELGKPRELTELMVLDLEEFVRNSKLAFIGSLGPDFYVSSIRGTTLVEQENDYELRVAGLGFGYNVEGSDTTSAVEVAVDDKELSFGAVRQLENHVVTVRVPSKRLASKFADDKIAQVKFTFRVNISKKVGPLSGSKKYEVSIPLILMPKYPGSITVEEVIEEKAWSNPQKKTIILSRNTSGEAMYREDKWSCVDNQRITSVTYECKDPRAGWSYSVRQDGVAGHNYDPDYDIVDGGRTAVVRRKLDTAPLTCSYEVTYETLAPVSKSVTNGTYHLKYDTPLEILLSPNNRKGNFKVTGRLYDGRKISLNSETAPTDKSSPLVLRGLGEAGDRVRATFVLKPSP